MEQLYTYRLDNKKEWIHGSCKMKKKYGVGRDLFLS